MPRKAARTSSEIFEALKDLYFVDDEGRVLNLKHSVWEQAHIKLNNEMSRKYIFLYVSQNRNGLLNKLLDHYGISCIEQSREETSISSVNENSDHPNWSIQSPKILPSLRATIHLSSKTWSKIAPIDIAYKNRPYKILNKCWTDVIAEELWKSFKLPCCFAFKNAKVNDKPGEIYVKIWGKCSECDTKINAYALNKPTVDGIDIHISGNDTTGIKHTKKRQLRGIRRRNVVKDICASSVYAWRRETANEIMSFGDVEPAHLYNEDVLRKAKQLEKD